VKKLRLAGIDDYDGGRTILAAQYWPQHTGAFALAPAAAVDFHEPVRPG